jgi:hypothetical protein
MGYTFVGHLLPWIFLKHMAFKNIVYSLFKFLITGSTNDDTWLDWKALVTCWNLRVCVLIKWGTSMLVICSFEFHLSMLPSRMSFTVYNSS